MTDLTLDQYITTAYPLLALFCFGFGACIGSFLNVCIYRIPLELSVVRPGSHCPICKHSIHWQDNVPLLSYIVLRARCRHCGVRIAPRYFAVELITAVLFLLVWLKLSFLPEPRPLWLVATAHVWLVPVYWLAIGGLVLGSFVDLDYLIIPDRVTIGGVAIGVLLSALVPAMHNATSALDGLVASTKGAAFGGLLLWGIAALGTLAFKREAMGMGDVKLLAAIGAFLGWIPALFSIIVSSLIGSIAGVALIAARRRGLQSRIPYGPFLSIAAIIWILWGPAIAGWYMNILRGDFIALHWSLNSGLEGIRVGMLFLLCAFGGQSQ